MSVDVSKAEIGTGPHFKRGPLSARLDGFDDIQMNPAAAGASHGPVFGAGAAGNDAQDRERLNSGVQSVLVKETFRPADLVERIRRLVLSKPFVGSGMEAAS